MKLGGLALLLSPQTAAACAVCFGGDANSPVARAITIGILILLSVTFSLIAGLAFAVWRIERQRSRAEAAAQAAAR